MIRRAALLLLVPACGIFHGERVADRPRAPIDTTERFDAPAPQPAPADPPELAFVEPSIGSAVLRNGVRIVWLERRDLPITSATIALGRGSDDAPPGAMAVLFHGMQFEIAPDLQTLGGEANRFVAHDAAGLELAMLESHTGPVLRAAGTRFLAPSFDGIDGSRHAVAGQARSMQPEALASTIALELAGFQPPASAQSIDRLSASEIASVHKDLVTPGDVVVSIAGSFDPAATVRVLDATFGSMSAKPSPYTTPSPSIAAPATKLVVANRPRSQQASIAFALRAPTIGEPDDAVFQVVCEILGTRANVVARERKGYTYGVHPSCGALFDRVLLVSLDADGARAHEALDDVLGALEGLVRDPPSERELAAGRTRVGARLVGTFQSNRTASTVLALATLHGAPKGAFGALWHRVRNVTPEDARTAIHRWFVDPRVAIVGDASTMPGEWPASLGKPERR